MSERQTRIDFRTQDDQLQQYDEPALACSFPFRIAVGETVVCEPIDDDGYAPEYLFDFLRVALGAVADAEDSRFAFDFGFDGPFELVVDSDGETVTVGFVSEVSNIGETRVSASLASLVAELIETTKSLLAVIADERPDLSDHSQVVELRRLLADAERQRSPE